MPRLNILIDGVVQGVGFRPFIYRISVERGLLGWVRNRPDGVEVEIQGPQVQLDAWLQALEKERPAPARIRGFRTESREEEAQEQGFRILQSGASDHIRPAIPADLAMCPECSQEMQTPGERRYRYPFTNCTYCGPRYSIIGALPYDRPRTSMAGFPLCPQCEREYRDPLDRRFHAQPVACPICGPRLELRSRKGESLGVREEALNGALVGLRQGQILALKGLGGFQLLVDARSEESVQRLRQRKRREEKPFAVMFPNLEQLESFCVVTSSESEYLLSPEAPILLLERRDGEGLAPGIAPGNPRLGAFLPYTPLHRLLLNELAFPVVCTSGNVSDEPMVIEESEALQRLGEIADLFLVHDRPILRPVDDSVLRMDPYGPTLLRRARGFSPLAHPVAVDAPPILALGAHQKSTVCLLFGGQAVLSQHLGDLDSLEGAQLLERTVQDLLSFFGVQPDILVSDLHPDYASTRLGEQLSGVWGKPLIRIQHHHAHALACAAENALNKPFLALTWDGSGFGPDQTIWGGEALRVDGSHYERLAHLRNFPLPGGDRAIREPRRSALGLLWSRLGPRGASWAEAWFQPSEFGNLIHSMEQGRHAPLTSSMGRLFDGVAALAGLRLQGGFEGQAAMELEFAASRCESDDTYPWEFLSGQGVQANESPLLESILHDLSKDVPPKFIARKFHNSLGDLALHVAQEAGLEDVALSGGCFQNRLLTQILHQRLSKGGFRVWLHHLFPPNDGCIALGQAMAGALQSPHP